MADELFDGVLGGDDDKSESAVSEPMGGADAFAAAVAARLSANDPQVARDTSVFLKKQARLLDLQAQHLEDEHTSRLTHLRLTVGAAKRKRYADYMRNGFYTCIALIALGVLLAAIRMTVQAMTDHSLVVEDFTVPPDLAARGATGQALAEELASRVAAIRSFVNRGSLKQTESVRIDQSTALKVQIPETGISLDELERFLHGWLGHQTVVDGEVREETDGRIAILLHIPGAAPIEVRGPSDQLGQLIETAAEGAFSAFDPVNYVVYLVESGRSAEALSAARDYVQTHGATNVPLMERAEAYSLLTLPTRDLDHALEIALIATDIDPHCSVCWLHREEGSKALGHDQATVDFARKLLGTRLEDQPVAMRATYAGEVAEIRIDIDRAQQDWAAVGRDEHALEAIASLQSADSYALSAQASAALHALAPSREELALARAAGPADATVLTAQWDVSAAAGDWPQALRDAQELVASATPSPAAPAGNTSVMATDGVNYLKTQYQPWLAYAEAMNGDTTAATTLIDQTPTDCYLCVRTRAKIAAAAGDAATADRWFAEAVRQAPDLPTAHFEWGQALLARGDLAGAARELALARAKGPHWADPLKAWGDVLAKQGHWKGALAKYNEALKYAPNWAALRQARAAAAARTST